ncbi:hypothetical protein BH24DEI2_BH24DEI2_10360 [soil metagenome]
MLKLLGKPVFEGATATVELPATRVSWLLVYLGYHGEWLTRQQLAFFFRPDADNDTALHYLRKLLAAARLLPWAEGLEIERTRVRWHVPTDLARFRAAKAARQWAEAYRLFEGELAAGLDAADSLSYDEWLTTARRALVEDFAVVALHHADELAAMSDHVAAAEVACKLLEYTPLSEEAARCYARNTHLLGHRSAAVSFLRRFKQTFSDEFVFGVGEETERLFAELTATGGTQEVAEPVSGDRLEAGFDYALDLAKLLLDPNVRLLNLGNTNTGDEIVISKRVSSAHAFGAVVSLVEHLLTKGHTSRATELAMQVLTHQACSDTVRYKLLGLLTEQGKSDTPFLALFDRRSV